MSAEIELKFLADPADLAAVLAATSGEDLVSRALIATYFDTPDRDLASAQAALRLRDDGNGRLQTLKIGEGFSRQEFETPAPFEGLDLDQRALKKALKADQRRQLEPVFIVTVARRSRVLTFNGARIELALDEGEIVANACRQALCEVELELKEGSPLALFELARHLCATAPLYLYLESKAAQGQSLSSGQALEPWRQSKAQLTGKHSVRTAFQHIARTALAQITSCAAVLRHADSVDALHQLRIGVRRLRSAMSSFKKVAVDPKRLSIQAELNWLLGACDEARDLDVFVRDNGQLEAADSAFGASVEAERQKVHAKAIEALSSQRFRDLALEAFAWIEAGDWLNQASRKSSIGDFASKVLRRALRHVLKRGSDLRSLSDIERHGLRIAAKKLRYSAEAFAPLLKTGPALIGRVKALQDGLGDLNDAVVAGRIVERLALPAAETEVAERLLQLRRDKYEAHLAFTEKSMMKLAKGNLIRLI